MSYNMNQALGASQSVPIKMHKILMHEKQHDSHDGIDSKVGERIQYTQKRVYLYTSDFISYFIFDISHTINYQLCINIF